MALPELREPSGLPCWLLADHGITPDPLHDDVPVLRGHGRKRKIYTTTPRHAVVSRDLSEAQAAAYDDWFENAAIVGNARFTAEVARLGADSRYWAAQWVDPPLWDARATPHGKRYRYSGVLLLTGEGSDTPPLGGTLSTEYGFELTGSGRVTSGVALSTEYGFELSAINPLRTEYSFELERIVLTYYDREDSGNIEREDGSRLERE